MKLTKLTKVIAFIICLLIIIANFIPLPYYISKPGKAMELEPIIDVEGGYAGKGSFMLTTVRMGEANVFNYTAAKLMDYWKIYTENEIRGEEETDAEYEVRQLYLMEGSKEKAIISAFEAASKPYKVTYKGIYVYSVFEGMPATDILKVGDRITEVDGNIIESSKQFTDYVSSKKEGDFLEVKVVRDDKSLNKTIKLQVLPNTKKIGIGIQLTDDIDVISEPVVEIDSETIGGPSAGLMFTLEIYNQLTEEDITKGFDIAGTGTIDEEGNIGPIGGIDQKVVAAHKNGAEIFFAPNEKGAKDSNYATAKKTAEDIGTDMEIVPVDTFDEAIEYLDNLAA